MSSTDDSTPSPDDSIDPPPAVSTLARGYWRRTLVLRSVLGLGWFLACLALLATFPFLPAVALIVVLIGALVAPVFRTNGQIRLRTDRDVKIVREDFCGPTPPLFGFQAALADDIRSTPDGAEYDLSALFGLRSSTMSIQAHQYSADSANDVVDRIHGDDATDSSDATDASSITDVDNGRNVVTESETVNDTDSTDSTDSTDTDVNAPALELTVTVDDHPWGHYRIMTRERQGETDVVIEAESTRRFSIRRLPDWIVAKRYRARLFDAQGYRLLAHDSTLSVR